MQKRGLLMICILIGVAVTLVLAVSPGRHVQALPEYAAQTGEPCASCHISPSGGGPRTPRGQAWIADGKPGAVPDLLASLAFLGVDLDVDPDDFTEVPDEIPPAQLLHVRSVEAGKLYQHLSEYSGN